MLERVKKSHEHDLSNKVIMFQFISVVGVVTLVLLAGVAFSNKNITLAGADLLAATVLATNLFIFKKTGNYQRASLCGLFFVGLFFLYLLVTGGEKNSAILWLYTFPLVAFFALGARNGAVASSLFLAPACLFFLFGEQVPSFTRYQPDFVIRFLPSWLVVCGYAFLYESLREKKQNFLEETNRMLEEEVHKRTAELLSANKELQAAVEEIDTLRGIIPICSFCKKIRDDNGYWGQVEEYITAHSAAQFSHGVCPNCMEEQYGMKLASKETGAESSSG